MNDLTYDELARYYQKVHLKLIRANQDISMCILNKKEIPAIILEEIKEIEATLNKIADVAWENYQRFESEIYSEYAGRIIKE